MGINQILEIIERYKLRIPPTVFYELKAEIINFEEPTTKNDFALLEKTYDDFCKCEGGEGWLKIDGKEYATDAGYAIEGVDIFMEVFKRRMAKLPSVTPQEPILDKIRAEIEQQEKWLIIAGYNAYNADIAFNAIKSEVAKYKAESEE